MALSQVISTDYGVNASYWKVLNVHFNRTYKTVEVIVAGYLDEESKNNGSNILKTFEYTMSENIICPENSQINVIHQIYDHIKTLGDFNTAIDC
jgi:hypothetical protein